MSEIEELKSDQIYFYSKLEVAEHQLNQSLELFINEKDYICAITLAGASEEILGKLLNSKGIENSLENWIEACLGFAKIFSIGNLDKKTIISDANYFRDGLKHITDGNSICVTKVAAIEIIERAIQNFVQLTGNYNSQMIEFHRTLNV